MTDELGTGRFGPVHIATDPDSGDLVVVRVFDRPMDDAQRHALVAALRQLSELPLEHASIARPLEAGVQDGRPYLVHTHLPGVPVDEYLRTHGRLPFSDVSVRVTHMAAAIDFAAAVGVCHGALGPRDILFAPAGTGVSGFGLAQALNEAGIEGGRPTVADDIYALAAMTYELLVGERYAGGDVRGALAAVPGLDDVNLDALSGALQSALSAERAEWPASALQFAGSLHDSMVLAGPPSRVEDSAVSAMEPAPPFTGRLALHDTPVSRDAHPEREADAELPLFDAPFREPDPAPFADEGPPPHETLDEEPAPEPLQFDPAPFSASSYPAPAGRAGVPPAPRGESWLPHPLTVATLTVIVLVAIGAGLFLLGDLGSGIGGLPPGGEATSGGQGESTDAHAVSGDGGQTPADGGAAGPDVNADTGWPADAARDSSFRDRVAPPPVPVEPDPVPVGGDPGAAATGAVPARPPAAPPAGVDPPAVAAPRAVPPSRGAPEPQPVAVSQGRVLVRSDPPGARVSIDDQVRGETPVAIRGLTLGTHTIVVTAPGLPPWRREVTLTAEQPSQSFEIALGVGEREPAAPSAASPGSSSAAAAAVAALLQVDSRPSGAEVWVDGRLVGTTPLQLSGIDAGMHEVRLEMPGYRPWATTVSVGRGERRRVAASLEQQ